MKAFLHNGHTKLVSSYRFAVMCSRRQRAWIGCPHCGAQRPTASVPRQMQHCCCDDMYSFKKLELLGPKLLRRTVEVNRKLVGFPPGGVGRGGAARGQGPYHHRKTTVIHSRQTNCEEIKPFCTFGEGGRGEGEPPTDAAMIGEDVQGEPLENLRLFWYPSKTRRRNKLHSFYLAAAVWAKPPTIRSLRRVTT